MLVFGTSATVFYVFASSPGRPVVRIRGRGVAAIREVR